MYIRSTGFTLRASSLPLWSLRFVNEKLFAAPSDNMGRKGPGLVAVVYYHATYLFVYNFCNVIMLVHDSVLIADFLVVLESG